MDKKDIYEHLADIYLDASSSKKKKSKATRSFFKRYFPAITFLSFLAIFSVTFLVPRKSMNSQISLVLQPNAVKMNFHFDPAKKEIYSLDLNKLDMSRYRDLGFAVKKVDSKDVITLRIEFISGFKESSECYVRDIPDTWQEYKIPLSSFKKISDWSNVVNLSFVVEQWNTAGKRGIVYIDNVRLMK